MSNENAVLFTRAAERKTELNERLLKTNDVGDWVNIAWEAGFEFTVDELRFVVEKTIGKKVTTANVVPEYIAARQAMGAGELSLKAIELFIGGVEKV